MFSSQVFAVAYGTQVDLDDNDNLQTLIGQFMEKLTNVHPELVRKQKFHTLTHLQDDMLDFGPPSDFATERQVVQQINTVVRHDHYLILPVHKKHYDHIQVNTL